jgi:hypothetical protein
VVRELTDEARLAEVRQQLRAASALWQEQDAERRHHEYESRGATGL